MIYASANGHTDIVKLLTDHGADINVSDQFGSTALIFASRSSYIEIVKLLINCGANVNISDYHGRTALAFVVLDAIKEKAYLEIIKLLIDSGANTNTLSNQDWKDLRSRYNNNKDITELLKKIDKI